MRNVFLSAVIFLALPASGFAAAAMPATTPAATPARAAAPAKPGKFQMAAFVSTIEGSVQVQLGGSDIWALAKADQELPGGSQIKTQAGSSCIVGFTDGSKVRIGPNATFKIEEVSKNKIALFIGLGKLESWVSKMAKRTFQARNPVSVASVRGTMFTMNVLSATNVEMMCFTGGLAITDNFGRTTPLGAGQAVKADAAKGAEPPEMLPAGAAIPAEPLVEIPEAIMAAAPPAGGEPEPAGTEPEAAPAADEAPAEETFTEPGPTNKPAENAPTPNPAQETVVSPSAP